MSIQGVSTGSSAISVSTGRLSLSGGEDFSKSLNLGQIIKGKVMRHYEGSRYLVNFDGQDKVVDSGVPLTTGEIIRGRVIAVGDRVELQRMYENDGAEVPANEGGLQRDRSEQWLDDLLTRYRADLSADDRAALNQIARSVSDPAALGMVGVALNKLGLLQSPELLQTVYALLKRVDLSTQLNSSTTKTSEDVSIQMQGATLVSVRQLADALSKTMGQTDAERDRAEKPDLTSDTTSNASDARLAINPRLVKRVGDEEERQQEQAAWTALNAQSDGAVAHRVGTLPLLVGDRLMEVSVALFEQRRDSNQQQNAQHRQLVFALQTERLGAVQVSARVSGEHVRVRIVTENEAATQELADYAGELRETLTRSGWQVDEIAHESGSESESNPAVASVIEHIALQDSLNRLV